MDLQQAAGKPTDATVEANGNNANAVATLAAPGVGYCWLVTGYTMSTDGNLGAKVTGTVISGTLTIDQFRAPAALPVDRVVEFTRGVRCPENTSVVGTLPAGGVGIIGDVVLRATKVGV